VKKTTNQLGPGLDKSWAQAWADVPKPKPSPCLSLLLASHSPPTHPIQQSPFIPLIGGAENRNGFILRMRMWHTWAISCGACYRIHSERGCAASHSDRIHSERGCAASHSDRKHRVCSCPLCGVHRDQQHWNYSTSTLLASSQGHQPVVCTTRLI
jgi:hypothetical protein